MDTQHKQEDRRIRQVVRTIRPLMAHSFSRDSCIAATRICIDSLAAFGVVAEPVAVRVVIFNPAMVRNIERFGRLPSSREETLEWYERCGAWSVGIGSGLSQPGRWPGHLVAYVAAHRLLIDLSLDQATRREHGIVLNPTVLEVPVDSPFFNGEPLIETINGCLLSYERISNDGYQVSPNWHVDPPVVAITQKTVAIIQARRR